MNLIDVVSKAVPALGLALGGPAGGIVGTLIASLFNGDITKPEELAQKITEDPDASLKLQQLKVQLAQIDSDNYKTEVDDRKNARDMNIAFVNKTGKQDSVLINLSYIITLGFFGALYLVFFKIVNVNAEEGKILGVLIGILASKWQTIVDFFFGSSHT